MYVSFPFQQVGRSPQVYMAALATVTGTPCVLLCCLGTDIPGVDNYRIAFTVAHLSRRSTQKRIHSDGLHIQNLKCQLPSVQHLSCVTQYLRKNKPLKTERYFGLIQNQSQIDFVNVCEMCETLSTSVFLSNKFT